VNTDALAKHYGSLTPWERLPLILAALARGDEQEWSRLVQTAPQVTCTVPDHAGLARALRGVSTTLLLALLEDAVCYSIALGSAVTGKGKAAKRMQDEALLHGYLIKARLAGWRQFCAEHQFPPERPWAGLPGWGTIQRFGELVEEPPCTHADARRCAKRLGRDPAAVPTAEGVAAALRIGLQHMVER
jgi:hypothetical protein